MHPSVADEVLADEVLYWPKLHNYYGYGVGDFALNFANYIIHTVWYIQSVSLLLSTIYSIQHTMLLYTIL